MDWQGGLPRQWAAMRKGDKYCVNTRRAGELAPTVLSLIRGARDRGIDITTGDEDLTAFIQDFELIPGTVITGKLLYKLASDGQITNGGSRTSVASGNTPATGSSSNNDHVNYDNTLYHNAALLNNCNSNSFTFSGGSSLAQNLTFHPPFGAGYMNGHTVNLGGASPLANTRVRLVARFNYAHDDGFFDNSMVINGWHNDFEDMVSCFLDFIDVLSCDFDLSVVSAQVD